MDKNQIKLFMFLKKKVKKVGLSKLGKTKEQGVATLKS